MYLELEHISKKFGERTAVRDLSLGAERGELLCLLGPSGCGKTTTLNMIGGFIMPDEGRITLDGADITRLEPERRALTTVFQSYALFPHLNVIRNVMYGLKFLRMGRGEAREKAMRYLEMVNMADYAASRVDELSGGQQQRVALARALVVEPKVCLLDEPFSNLDASLRVRMRSELKQLQKKLNMTMLFVTHDQEEAMILADRIAVMREGRLLQCGAPKDVHRCPADPFVAEFLDTENMFWDEDGGLVKRIKK